MINKFKIKKGLPRGASAKRGFTVLESIVAIMILSLSISGAFSAVQQSLSQAMIAKDEIKAFYLAQEAVETIRNKRDANQLIKINTGPVSWLNGITSACPFSTAVIKNTCTVDTTDFNIVNCGGDWGSCPNLRQNPLIFVYGYEESWPASNFKREIQIESINANEIIVTVRVTWTKGVIDKEFKIKTHLLNWI